MPDFTRIIHLAYQRILGRPADLDGLDNYNRLMNRGMTEADMRESLLRSAEYAEKNPGAASAARARRSGAAGKRKKARRRR
jgi:hypothetical protein